MSSITYSLFLLQEESLPVLGYIQVGQRDNPEIHLRDSPNSNTTTEHGVRTFVACKRPQRHVVVADEGDTVVVEVVSVAHEFRKVEEEGAGACGGKGFCIRFELGLGFGLGCPFRNFSGDRRGEEWMEHISVGDKVGW